MKLIDIALIFSALAWSTHSYAATNYSTPNMNLTIPIPGQESGPAWASDINGSLTLIDSHDHSPGKGVPITPNGLNINANLTLQGNFITNLGGGFFTAQSADPSTNASIYSKGVDLYYKDGNGNVIQITASGGVAGTPGSIANLTAPASASFVSASGTFVWQQSTNTAANMDEATAILRYPGSYPAPSGVYIALQVPSSIASGYAITLPTGVPSSTSFMSMDSSGNLAATIPTYQGIQQNMLALRSTGSTVGAGGVAISGSSGSFSTTSTSLTAVTNLSVTITTTGRPVMVFLTSDGSGNTSNYACLLGNFSSSSGIGVQIKRGSTQIYFSDPQSFSGFMTGVPCSSIMVIDPVSAGTYTYSVAAASLSGTAIFYNSVLVAYEL